jgi:hypothetical protein
MAEKKVLSRTLTFTVSDLSPAEMASVFAGWDDGQQAAFFHALHEEAQSWPGGGWWLQIANACDKMSPEALSVMREFADAIGGR